MDRNGAALDRIVSVMNQAQIDALNRAFGIPNVAAVISGNGGLAKIRVTAPSASAEIYLQGAQITSWQPAGEKEVLFLSQQSHWQDGRAIRGGIPICFPWFRSKADDPAAPAHGFVRTKEWRLESVKAEGDSVAVVCSTESDESTQRWWPHAFRLVHVHHYRQFSSASIDCHEYRADPVPFRRSASHLLPGRARPRNPASAVSRAPHILDNVDGNHQKTQSGDVIFTGKTDNAYLDVRGAAELIDPAGRRTIRTEKENSATTVVWNPGQDGAASLSDLGDEEWRQFACVEASNILGSSISLAPGQEHRMHAMINVLAL